MRDFFLRNQNSTFFHLAVLFAVALMVTAPIFVNGIPTGNDLPPHYQFAAAFYDSLRGGILYPGWSDTVNYGYGGVGIRFYPPLTYYILAFFRWLSGNWYDATCLTVLFLFFTGAAGVYLWAREWFSGRAACLAGIVYILIPYHANQIYNAFFFAEFAAAAFLPFCFLFATRVCRRGRAIDVLGLAVFYALLVLTHLPTTVNGSLALLVYCLASLERKTLFDRLAKLAASVAAGLAASSFYWVRMITELDFYNISQSAHSSGDYSYRINFVWVKILPFFGIENARFAEFLDMILLMTFCVFLPGMLIHFYWTKRAKGVRLYNVLAALAFSIFMTTPLSALVWENFSFLQKTQFPFRWLVVVSVCAPIFVAAGFEPAVEFFRDKRRPAAILAAGLLFAGLIFTPTRVMRPLFEYAKAELNPMVERLKIADTDEGLMPMGAGKRAFAEAAERRMETISSSAAERTIIIEAGEAESTKINMFYYPHWRAFVGEKEIEIAKTESGAMRLSIPRETTQVVLKFDEPAAVEMSYSLSLFSWLALFLLSAVLFLKKAGFPKTFLVMQIFSRRENNNAAL